MNLCVFPSLCLPANAGYKTRSLHGYPGMIFTVQFLSPNSLIHDSEQVQESPNGESY
jgi:hypothetical protein